MQSDYNRKAPKHASAKQKAPGLLKLGGWFLSNIYKSSLSPISYFPSPALPNPGQKMAQLDAARMQDLFSLACLMAWLKPKMEVQLGKDSLVLERIDEMWDLGLLGLFLTKKFGELALGKKTHHSGL